jgi:CBS domain containing-hemolysin-like protein
LVLEHGYSRVPVFHEDLDDVVGVIFAKDVLKALHQGNIDMPLVDIARMPRFVPESKKVADLLREMQREKFHLAIVTDEYGSVTGIISLEDLLEELVGEIADEYDRDEPDIVEVSEGVYRVSGKTSIDDLNDELDAELPDEDWDTVAGLVLDVFGKIPASGEECVLDGWRFKTEEVRGRRIATVLVSRVTGEGPDEEDVTDDG